MATIWRIHLWSCQSAAAASAIANFASSLSLSHSQANSNSITAKLLLLLLFLLSFWSIECLNLLLLVSDACIMMLCTEEEMLLLPIIIIESTIQLPIWSLSLSFFLSTCVIGRFLMCILLSASSPLCCLSAELKELKLVAHMVSVSV